MRDVSLGIPFLLGFVALEVDVPKIFVFHGHRVRAVVAVEAALLRVIRGSRVLRHHLHRRD